MTRVRVFGIGSPVGDDQVGWRVVETLTDSGVLGELAPQVSMRICDRPGAELIRQMEGAQAVILVDALVSRGAPGAIHRFHDETAFDHYHSPSSHGFGVANALALARVLGTLPESVVVYGVEIENLAPESPMTPQVRRAVLPVVRMIADELRQRLAVTDPRAATSASHPLFH